MSVLAALNHLDDATDGQLLGRFVRSRDADAFAALVRRLGPTVLAVCRRVCPDAHLAEDAFQAAFLVLARKADTVRPREQVAVWLHGVAYRTASKARSMLANRRCREVGSSGLPEPPAPDAALPDEELQKLDAAIAGLPDHLRAAVVLCELEGRSRKDAAKQLGIPEGTLSSRLADARKRLGQRLRPTTAVVTVALASRTAEAAISGSTSETVRSLARGVMSMMLLNKLKLPAMALLIVAMAALAVPLMLPAYSAPVPKALKQPVGTIGVTRGDVLYLLTRDGTTTHEFDVRDEWELEWTKGPCKVHASPTGFPVAVIVPRDRRKNQEAIDDPWRELRLLRSADDLKGEVVKVEGHLTGELVWSRTGKRFYVGTQKKDGKGKVSYLAIDPATGRTTESAVPEEHTLVAELADGTLVTDGTREKVPPKQVRPVDQLWYLHKVSADGKTVTELTPCPHDIHHLFFDLSPDGNTVLTWRYDKAAESDVLYAFDLTTGKSTDFEPKALKGARVEVYQVLWSPDGKKVGVISSTRKGLRRGFDPNRTLHICDRDGTNGKDVFTWKGEGGVLGEVWDAHFQWN